MIAKPSPITKSLKNSGRLQWVKYASRKAGQEKPKSIMKNFSHSGKTLTLVLLRLRTRGRGWLNWRVSKLSHPHPPNWNQSEVIPSQIYTIKIKTYKDLTLFHRIWYSFATLAMGAFGIWSALSVVLIILPTPNSVRSVAPSFLLSRESLSPRQ